MPSWVRRWLFTTSSGVASAKACIRRRWNSSFYLVVCHFERQKLLQIVYRGTILQKHYVADLVCRGQIMVELKAQKAMGAIEEGQAICYLNATGFRLALLINFGDPARLDWQRIVR